MEYSKQVEEFNSTKLIEFIEEAAKDVKFIGEQLDVLSKTESPKKSEINKMRRDLISQSFIQASLLLEQHDVEWLTDSPGNAKEDNMFRIIEKRTPNKWIIEDSNKNQLTVYRNKNHLFKLDKKYLYNSYPLDFKTEG